MWRFQKKKTRTLHDVWFLTFIFSGSKQDPRQSRDTRTLFRSKWKIGYCLSLFVLGFIVDSTRCGFNQLCPGHLYHPHELTTSLVMFPIDSCRWNPLLLTTSQVALASTILHPGSITYASRRLGVDSNSIGTSIRD